MKYYTIDEEQLDDIYCSIQDIGYLLDEMKYRTIDEEQLNDIYHFLDHIEREFDEIDETEHPQLDMNWSLSGGWHPNVESLKEIQDYVNRKLSAQLTSKGYLTVREVLSNINSALGTNFTSGVEGECYGLLAREAKPVRYPCDAGERKEHTPIIPINMWYQNGYTTVEWDDGDKTTVHADDPEHATEYLGFVCAFAKKMFGSHTLVEKHITKAKEGAQWRKNLKAKARQREKELKQMKHEARMRERERKIQARMDELRITNEAHWRLCRAETRKSETGQEE